MSLIFAFLVGFVIVGFFVVAFRDERVETRDFLQGPSWYSVCDTLFSLVIAIILFGIIDILEGKELAALFGGLSGYILGRSTSTEGDLNRDGRCEKRIWSKLRPELIKVYSESLFLAQLLPRGPRASWQVSL